MAQMIWLGIILGVFASMTGTIGKQLLRFSELQRQKGFAFLSKAALSGGLALNVAVGPIVDMGSYAFAPQVVIAPLGGLDVVWNTLIAPCTLGEKLTPTLIVGVVLIAAGATGTSFFGNHGDKEYTLQVVQDTFVRPAVGIYLGFLALWAAFNILVLQPRSSAPQGQPWAPGDPIRGLSLGMTAGSISGNMFCVKAFVELVETSIRQEDAGIWAHWLPYVTLVGAVFFALSNVFFLQKAMREYEALFMGAIFEGTLIISACISGFVVFADAVNLKWWQLLLYWLMLIGMVAGIVLVAMGADPKLEESSLFSDQQSGVAGDDLGKDEENNDCKPMRSDGTANTQPPRLSPQVSQVSLSLSIRTRQSERSSKSIDSPFSGSVRLDLVERALSAARVTRLEGDNSLDNAPESTVVGARRASGISRE